MEDRKGRIRRMRRTRRRRRTRRKRKEDKYGDDKEGQSGVSRGAWRELQPKLRRLENDTGSRGWKK